MDSKQLVTFQSSILIILGATYHSASIYYIVWDWLPFHLGYYLFALGTLQLLKSGSMRNDDLGPWCAVQAFFLLWVAFWLFEPTRDILRDNPEIFEDMSPFLASSLWGWHSWGFCLVIFGYVQLIKIQGAKSPKLSFLQALLLIFWGIGFFKWGMFVWEFLSPLEYYNYLLALGIMEFLKTLDMDTYSISSGRTKPSYGSQNSSKPILDRQQTLMFKPENELANIECPGCSAKMDVPKLGAMQKVTCDECGLSGEIEI